MNYEEKRVLAAIAFVEENIDLAPEMLSHIAVKFTEFKTACKKQCDMDWRNATTSALAMLAEEMKPGDELVPMATTIIRKVVYPNGIESASCEAERIFWRKYLEGIKDD